MKARTLDLSGELVAIGRRARLAREISGLSLGQAAARLQWPREWLERLEAGRFAPLRGLLVQLAGLYGCAYHWLLCRVPEVLTPEELGIDPARVARVPADDVARVLLLLSMKQRGTFSER